MSLNRRGIPILHAVLVEKSRSSLEVEFQSNGIPDFKCQQEFENADITIPLKTESLS